jgi:hypothetical protein
VILAAVVDHRAQPHRISSDGRSAALRSSINSGATAREQYRCRADGCHISDIASN